MSQSKSILMPFIVIAVILFGSAVAWKMMGQTESEEKNTTITESKKPVKKTENKAEQPAITVKNYEPTENLKVNLSEQERAESKKISQNFLKFAMQYQTKESVVEALKKYKDNGNKEKYHYLSLFAEDHYPDLDIPSFE
ncbi:hypothetical protein [Marinicella rhabdoformis]|uniref:hypothetical protein n=1 Tax=Marinicella rhabdoformis TaxID=2580566 RepID=UPI0012AEB3AD|nr:hypothetical protein [Marinicella rhabdoformis]